MMELTSANVDALVEDVLEENILSPDLRRVRMINHAFGLNMAKLEEHRQDISDMLSQLPKTFFPAGGGQSFTEACFRDDGVRWTESRVRREVLLSMGVALNMVQIMLPRSMCAFCPEDDPYILVDINGIKSDPGFSDVDEAQMVSQAASPAVYGAIGVDPSKPDQEGARE